MGISLTKNKMALALVICYLALAAAMLFLLFKARTPITGMIWTTFDTSNLAIYLMMTFILLIILISKGGFQGKLLLIVIHSIISHAFFIVVFEARWGWDQWVGVGMVRRIFSEDYSPQGFAWSIYSSLPLVSKLYHVMDRIISYSLTVILARMFFVDVWWTHLLHIVLMWGTFVPVLAYCISKFVHGGEKVAISSALLSLTTPSLILWGAITTGNSLGWLFNAFIVYLSLKYLSSKGNIWLLIMGIVAFTTFVTHELNGTIAFATVLLVYVYKKYMHFSRSKAAKLTLFSVFLICILALPLSLYLRSFLGAVTNFSLQTLRSLSAYDAILLLIFGEYVNWSLKDILAYGILPLLGLLGLTYANVTTESGYDKKTCRFLFLAFVLILIDYRIIRCFMIKVPFGEERLWAFRDILALPFAAITINKSMDFLAHKTQSNITTEVTRRTRLLKKAFSVDFRGVAGKTVILLSIAALVTLSVYIGYPQYTPTTWTTAYELRAAEYIDATTPERYIVICHHLMRLAGFAVVGSQNPRAYYYGPYEEWFRSLYLEMVKGPSLGPVLKAKEVNNATVVYFIISKLREPDADRIITQTMTMPHTELYGVFGDDVYVFKMTPPASRIITGVGPTIYVYNLQKDANTTFALDWITYDTTYAATLTGSSYYNVTGWPAHWSFESIEPSPIAKYIDANAWINFTGVENVEYTITWTTNVLYQPVGWKDDSFMTGWKILEKGRRWSQPPTMSTDGDVVKLTGLFGKGVRDYVWFIKDVNVSTSDYPYLVIKWRSTSTCAAAWVQYDVGLQQLLSPHTYVYGQYSKDWKVQVVSLEDGKTVKSVVIALDDYPSWVDTYDEQSVYFDFIMLTKMSTFEIP